LSDGSFQLQINDAALSPTPGLEPDQFWLNYPASQLPARGLTGRPALEPNLGTEAAIMQGGEDIAKTWRDAGYTTRSPLGYVIFNVAAVIRRNPSVLLSADLVEHYLTTLQATYPILVNAALKRFNVEALTQILRDKLDARASIRNLPGILESLLVTDALR
jgi:flagellar biosynthesis component FlhA